MAIISRETLHLAQSGDVQAQTSFVQLFQREVRAFVATISADVSAMDDLAQETFLRALDRLDRVREPESAGAFLRGIARNVVLEHVRRHRRQSERAEKFLRLMEDTREDGHGDDWWSDDASLLEALRGCLNTLPEKSRNLLDWRYREEYDATEIAARIDSTSMAVRAALKRIRIALWQCIRGKQDGLQESNAR